MTPGPRITATKAIHTFDDITDEWKIAAWSKGAGDGTVYWEWPQRPSEQGALRMAIHGGVATLSACQGKQMWQGAERWVLYARRMQRRGYELPR